MDTDKLILNVEQHIDINAPIAEVFEGLITRLSSRNTGYQDKPMPLKLERWPGGRWFRDLDRDAGHLWGFVQVIKPPILLELQGPMFMSYPVAGHLSLRLSETGSGTRVSLRHSALGLIQDDHRDGVVEGWDAYLAQVRSDLT